MANGWFGGCALKENIFLVGFSGTGKSTVGKLLAKTLSYNYIDTDLQIEVNVGQSVNDIFAKDGEQTFRQLERNVLDKICEDNFQVISTGGGAILAQANRAAMLANGYVICLEARPETILVRLMLDGQERPLLSGGDPYERINSLKAERQIYYAQADWTIHTDFLTPQEIVQEIENSLAKIRRRSDKLRGGPGSPATVGAPHYASHPHDTPFHRGISIGTIEAAPDLIVKTRDGSYPVLFGENLLSQVGELLKTHLGEVAQTVFVVSDTNVAPLYATKLKASLQAVGFESRLYTIGAGENSKSSAHLTMLYDWLAGERAERKSVLIALGGGVVGDLTGFVASSWLRGLPFVQIPTTLLAMVDSSVGGKTGVNHPSGKNLIGAFYPPQLVIADVQTLTSLPIRERRAGWSEVIKHAVLAGAGDEKAALNRFTKLERNAAKLNSGEPTLTTAILRESVAVKAAVVEQDERESGLRITLNYGHTFGHALEAAGRFQELLHGEAVAIGMNGVAILSQRLGLCTADFVKRQAHLLSEFGLPIVATGYNLDPSVIEASMKLDKKVEAGKLRWILPVQIGKVEIRNDISAELVLEVLDILLGKD